MHVETQCIASLPTQIRILQKINLDHNLKTYHRSFTYQSVQNRRTIALFLFRIIPNTNNKRYLSPELNRT